MFKRLKIAIFMEVGLVLLLLLTFISKNQITSKSTTTDDITTKTTDESLSEEKTYIKWVDFNVTSEALNCAYTYDIESYGKEIHINWIELLAYAASKNGGDFSKFKDSQISVPAEKILSGEVTMESLTKDLKSYSYYLESYQAVLGGLLGEFEIEIPDETDSEVKVFVKKYNLKGFLPIARGYEYSDYDDFGVSRSYGYKRRHLGHDMMGQVGTPIIAVESGYVEAIGWNQYGGWRIGIRSFDGLRYYYYAHLRKNFPYNKSLEEGSIVTGGDVIGYLGRTGYSSMENTNNIDDPHLHFGIQLIFDESQKEGNGEIWIDAYQIMKFLYKNRSQTLKNEDTKEYFRIHEMMDPSVEEFSEANK